MKGIHLVWGLNFEKLNFNNNTNIYEIQLRAEFNIKLRCVIGSYSFNESFKLYLTKNNISNIEKEYNNKYYIYIFHKNMYEKIKNFSLDFFHKELNYHFILDYQDLFFEKNDKIYCLIVFNHQEKYYWKFGLPFLKKYKFIYEQDAKIMGFVKNRIYDKNISNNEKNNYKNLNDEKKLFKIKYTNSYNYFFMFGICHNYNDNIWYINRKKNI